MRTACILLLLCAGCSSTTVIPPAHPQDPVTVYLTDYGRHASIVIPTSDDHYMEYAFGDWEFFAKGNTKLWVGIAATVHSRQATLGRREVKYPGDDAKFRRLLQCRRLMKFEASQQAVDVLSLNLDRPFRLSATRPTRSAYSSLDHVYDDTEYWGCHNCNHVTAEWLRQLGCKVDGPALLSNFEMDSPGGHATDVDADVPYRHL